MTQAMTPDLDKIATEVAREVYGCCSTIYDGDLHEFARRLVERIQREQKAVAVVGAGRIVWTAAYAPDEGAPLFTFPPATPSAVPAEIAYELGWHACADWADRDDLHADVGSPAYTDERDKCLLSAAPAPAGEKFLGLNVVVASGIPDDEVRFVQSDKVVGRITGLSDPAGEKGEQ